MSAAPSLYERIRALVDAEASGLSLARAKHEQDKPFSPLNITPTPVENPQVTTSTPTPAPGDSLSRQNPQVTTSTPCPYAENPKLTCARCWLEKHGRPIQAEAPAATGHPTAGRASHNTEVAG